MRLGCRQYSGPSRSSPGSATVKAGDAVVAYDCEGVTVGCAICYDLRFPDLFQALVDKGAEMIWTTHANPAASEEWHGHVLARRSAEQEFDQRP